MFTPSSSLRRLAQLGLRQFTQYAVIAATALGSVTAMAQTASDPANSVLTIYSARNEQLLQPLLDAFTKETGIKTQVRVDKEVALLSRLQSEGAQTPADVLITVDAGNLWQAAKMGVLQPLTSPILEKAIPAHLRDPANQWFGLSVRARTIIYNKKNVDPARLSSYQDLAAPAWRGKLCLRSSGKVYNQSLVAMMMAEQGEERTLEMVKGWVANLATPPFADDNAVIKAVAEGQCQVGIVNTYYLGRLLAQDATLPVGLFWANQNKGGKQKIVSSGVHVNISGAGLTRHGKHIKEGQRLLEFLVSPAAQAIYADQGLEFPVNPAVKANSIIREWGEFEPNLINVAKAGELQGAASLLMDKAGYR